MSTDVKTVIKKRVNFPMDTEVKRRVMALARKQRKSLSRFLQETVEERLRREQRADLDRQVEEAAKEMAEENLQEVREWEGTETEIDRIWDEPS